MERIQKRGSRYEPGEIRLKEGTGPITYFCAINDHLIVFKVDKTFEIVTPEVSDPSESNPNMPTIAKLISNEGSGNYINSRVFIQTHDAYKSFIQQDKIFNDVVTALYDAKSYLLFASDVKQKIENAIIEQDKVLPVKCNNAYTNMPLVVDLDKDVATYLMNTKLSIQNIVTLFNIFFNTHIPGPRFNEIVKKLKDIDKCDSIISRIVNEVEPNISYIVGMRNAQEHPSNQLRLIVNNYTISPNEKILKPTIQFNEEGPFDLAKELNEIIEFLVDTFEAITLNYLVEYLKPKYNCYIDTMPIEYINPNCPIRYRVVMQLPGIR